MPHKLHSLCHHYVVLRDYGYELKKHLTTLPVMQLVWLNIDCVAYDGIRNGTSSCRTCVKLHWTYFSSIIPRRCPNAVRQTFYLRYMLSLFISLEFFFFPLYFSDYIALLHFLSLNFTCDTFRQRGNRFFI